MLRLLLAQRAADAAVAASVRTVPGGFVQMDKDRSLEDTVQRCSELRPAEKWPTWSSFVPSAAPIVIRVAGRYLDAGID
ncbi:hypothetical protein GCM10010981_17380 [Dyella nitratireducens]|uniref:Uncharacterized protein n=1 Tax=Dyella nitratireducens TaxID=1849580 RepID=A0ABQ1FSA3_9GAMM|nr:hypothetical protein GCM10010981_17380 [Dyella nitratireducens]GLQ43197.1 hypothetical protein GCM10007902_30470 [Dyella nitratireducens]